MLGQLASIEDMGEAEVYDLEVEGRVAYMFIAGGLRLKLHLRPASLASKIRAGPRTL